MLKYRSTHKIRYTVESQDVVEEEVMVVQHSGESMSKAYTEQEWNDVKDPSWFVDPGNGEWYWRHRGQAFQVQYSPTPMVEKLKQPEDSGV